MFSVSDAAQDSSPIGVDENNDEDVSSHLASAPLDVDTTDAGGLAVASDEESHSGIENADGNGFQDDFLEFVQDVSISMTVLLLFTPIRRVMTTKCLHPCFVEHLNFNIPKSGRIHSMINSLSDNTFQIRKDEFNSFGLGAIGYDLFFFQDRILDEVGDDFKLTLTERARDKCQHEVGLRFKIEGSDTEYENQCRMLATFFENKIDAFQMHLVSVNDIVRFRELFGLVDSSNGFNPQETFQSCYLKTLCDFQETTRWRFAAMNGQNRLSAALSFMIGCNYSLQDWRLKPCSIDPWKTLDESGLIDLTDDSIKEYKIYGQIVGSIPSPQAFMDHINRARIRSKFTNGLRFNPSLDVRVVSNCVTKVPNPSISGFMNCLREISRKRALDERMLSNTSMPAKCAQIMQIIGDEIVFSFQQCLEFHQNYRGPLSKRSASFTTKFENYNSESDNEGAYDNLLFPIY